MARRRKTKAERQYEWDEAEGKVADYFLPKLEACQSIVEAAVLQRDAVPENKPGRRYYSNAFEAVVSGTVRYENEGGEMSLAALLMASKLR